MAKWRTNSSVPAAGEELQPGRFVMLSGSAVYHASGSVGWEGYLGVNWTLCPAGQVPTVLNFGSNIVVDSTGSIAAGAPISCQQFGLAQDVSVGSLELDPVRMMGRADSAATGDKVRITIVNAYLPERT